MLKIVHVITLEISLQRIIAHIHDAKRTGPTLPKAERTGQEHQIIVDHWKTMENNTSFVQNNSSRIQTIAAQL